MSEIINWIKESRGNTQGVYICTDWYDHELSYYLGFWPQDIDRMERSLREEIKEWLDHASTYDEGEISISGIYQNGELFSEDWSTDASTLEEPDKVLERIMELVKLTSNPETLPLKKIKEAEVSVRKAAQVHGKPWLPRLPCNIRQLSVPVSIFFFCSVVVDKDLVSFLAITCNFFI